MENYLPQARRTHLIEQPLPPDEVLIYDTQSHRAHCLNQAAALVWRHCNGQTTVAQMAAILHAALALPHDEAVVGLALDELRRIELLEETASLPPLPLLSRREFVKKLGVAGSLVALPVITSILAPAPVDAASGEGFNRGGEGIVRNNPQNPLDPVPPLPPAPNATATAPTKPQPTAGVAPTTAPTGAPPTKPQPTAGVAPTNPPPQPTAGVAPTNPPPAQPTRAVAPTNPPPPPQPTSPPAPTASKPGGTR